MVDDTRLSLATHSKQFLRVVDWTRWSLLPCFVVSELLRVRRDRVISVPFLWWHGHTLYVIATVYNRLTPYFKGSEMVSFAFQIFPRPVRGIAVFPYLGRLSSPFIAFSSSSRRALKSHETCRNVYGVTIKAVRYHFNDLRLVMFVFVQTETRISFGLCIVVVRRLLSFAASLRNRVSLDVRIRSVSECKNNVSLE